MAEVLVDGEFRLPPQFSTDDDYSLIDKNKAKTKPKNLEDGFGLYEFGFLGFSSDPSSPVESMMGSTETESDEEDYLAELTSRMTHSTLEYIIRRNDSVFAYEKPKGLNSSRSPRSTLRAARRGCGCVQGFSRGSSACQSRVSSSPRTWDLLYAAAGEVARMRMNRVSYGGVDGNGGFLGIPARKFSLSGDVSSFYSTPQSFDHRKIQAAQIMKQHQLKKNKMQQFGEDKSHNNNIRIITVTMWSTTEQESSSSSSSSTTTTTTTTVPIGLWVCPNLLHALHCNNNINNNPKLESGRVCEPFSWVIRLSKGNLLESVFSCLVLVHKLSSERSWVSCSTALLSARVVQALNLNPDEICSLSEFHSRFYPYFTADNDAALKFRSAGNELRQHQEMAHEVGLPQEWSY